MEMELPTVQEFDALMQAAVFLPIADASDAIKVAFGYSTDQSEAYCSANAMYAVTSFGVILHDGDAGDIGIAVIVGGVPVEFYHRNDLPGIR